jgi:hypothetical protein
MPGGGIHPAGQGSADKPAISAPEAIPGSKPRDAAAPATRAAIDMQPTEALFDSINRGDLAAARDALNRGADQSGLNILGMTPMELSVDLGRNDISFLLLSLRGEDSARGARASGRETPGLASKPTPKTTAPKSVQQVAKTQVVAKPVPTPKLFANDGGTPLPSAGFLGFGSRSAAN